MVMYLWFAAPRRLAIKVANGEITQQIEPLKKRGPAIAHI